MVPLFSLLFKYIENESNQHTRRQSKNNNRFTQDIDKATYLYHHICDYLTFRSKECKKRYNKRQQFERHTYPNEAKFFLKADFS